MIWTGSFAARSMIGMWLGAAIVSGLMLLIVGSIETLSDNRLVWTTMLVLFAMIWFGLIGLVIFRKLGQHYEMTSQRLKHRSGVIFRTVNRIEMIDIDDVIYKQGPLQAMLNVGTIELLSSDTSHPKLIMPGIPDVSRIANLIDNARREERRSRGLFVEAI